MTGAAPAAGHVGEPAGDGDRVLAVNAGSSSLKFGLYPATGPAQLVGQFSGLEPGGRLRWQLGDAPAQALDLPVPAAAGRPGGAAPGSDAEEARFDAALARLLQLLAEQAGLRLRAVAHRIVHGGDRHTAPVRLDERAIADLRALSPLAPLHQPHNLAGVAAFARALPGVPQIGCFDTAFHATLPPLEQRLPLPAALAAQGLRRYGFHGLSYQYLADTLPAHSARAGGRALLAHLGSGASLCATLGGRSVATTMGFSALDGLMMGTRSGSLDPGVLLHLWRQGWSLDQVETLLWRDSGLKGVSGESADLRALRASGSAAAQDAIALFVHRTVREAGALAALLGGLDLLAFTGGIGEHDAALRAAVVAPLAHLGLRLDAARNAAARGDAVAAIHAEDSAAEVWVVPTDEGRVAARAAFALLAGGLA